MRNRFFRDVTTIGRFAIKQKEESFFQTSENFGIFALMDDEMIDYGFEEDSVSRDLSVVWPRLPPKTRHLAETFD